MVVGSTREYSNVHSLLTLDVYDIRKSLFGTEVRVFAHLKLKCKRDEVEQVAEAVSAQLLINRHCKPRFLNLVQRT
jgi:hypothetical protein